MLRPNTECAQTILGSHLLASRRLTVFAAVFVSSSLGRFFPLVPCQDSEYSDVPPAQPRCHIITAGEFEASEQRTDPVQWLYQL